MSRIKPKKGSLDEKVPVTIRLKKWLALYFENEGKRLGIPVTHVYERLIESSVDGLNSIRPIYDDGPAMEEKAIERRLLREFKKPTLEQITDYVAKDLEISLLKAKRIASIFYNHYEEKKWKYGKKQLHMWPSALQLAYEWHSIKIIIDDHIRREHESFLDPS